MRNLKKVLLLCSLVILAGNALAQDGLVITPVEKVLKPFNVDPNKGAVDQGGLEDCCKIGNLNWYGNAVENFISGGESYSYIFEVNPVCDCNTGFYFAGVHMYMQFGEEDVPVTLQVNASFEETQMAPTGGGLIPGPPICTSPTYSGTITQAGGYDLFIPLYDTSCLCAEFGWFYAATVNFVNRFENKPDLVTDFYPVGGASFIDQGNGWYDLQSYQLPGEVKLMAKLLCCSTPVPEDQPTWGEVKALFR